MKKTSILKALLIGGTFLFVTSVTGSLLFEVSFWEAMVVGLVVMAILVAVFAFEGDSQKD